MSGGGRGSDSQMEERYSKLGIGESLGRIYQYPLACTELSFLLRGAYSKTPKNLQSLIFQHTLIAFRLLPQMQTQNAVSAANLLIRSAEAVLPKQKRVLAGTEFKHAKVAHKRHCKDRQEEASDNHLWHLQHDIYFGDPNNSLKDRRLQKCEMLENDEPMQLQEEVNTLTSIDWRDAFKQACKGKSSKKLTSYRGYCGHCNAVVWLSNMKCSNKHCSLNSKNQQISPVSTEQIVEYVLKGAPSMISSSDSEGDSDSDESSIFKLWAFPRRLSGSHK